MFFSYSCCIFQQNIIVDKSSCTAISRNDLDTVLEKLGDVKTVEHAVRQQAELMKMSVHTLIQDSGRQVKCLCTL